MSGSRFVECLPGRTCSQHCTTCHGAGKIDLNKPWFAALRRQYDLHEAEEQRSQPRTLHYKDAAR